jgi:low temperature requirement protein LtrA
VTIRQRWQKPNLRRDEEFDQHRNVTWLELFFDLVFVVVISRLAHNLSVDITISGFLIFVFMFISVWWVWNAATYYAERFETQGVDDRVFTLLKMIPVAGMAVFSEHGLEENYVGFAISFWLVRVINMAQWARAGIHVPAFRPVSNRFLIGFLGVVTPIIAVSLFVEPPLRIVLWSVAIVADIITPYFTLKQQAVLPPLSTSKFPERFGLLTIIVLGESLVGVVNGISGFHELTTSVAVAGSIGILISIGVWWVYFDFINERPAKPFVGTSMAWVYLHLLLMTSITIVGVGIFSAITDFDHSHLTDPSRILLASSAAFVLIFLGGLETTLQYKKGVHPHPLYSPLIKVSTGVAVLLIGVLVTRLTTVPLMVMILAAFAIQVVFGERFWITQEIDAVSQEH